MLPDGELDDKLTKMIDDEVADFKKTMKSYERKGYELNISYQAYNNGDLDSIYINVYRYLGGGRTEYKEYVYYYDRKERREVKWEDLFADGEKNKLLEKMSSQVNKEVVKLGVGLHTNDLVWSGLQPTQRNYDLLVFGPENIVLKLHRGQVAPVDTPIELVFEYREYDTYLKYKKSVIAGSADEEPIGPEESVSRRQRNIEKLRNKPVVMITFDDGPSGKVTSRLLDGLAKRNARATFFVLGNMAEKYPDILKREYSDGHTVASHSYSHKDMKNIGGNAIKWEVEATNEVLKRLLGIDNQYLRPPYGSFNDTVFVMSGMSLVLWNVDPQDWKVRDANAVYSHIMEKARDGSIILIHDIYEESVDGALRAIDDLLRQGYAVVSLEEAEQLGYVDKETQNKYYKLK